MGSLYSLEIRLLVKGIDTWHSWTLNPWARGRLHLKTYFKLNCAFLFNVTIWTSLRLEAEISSYFEPLFTWRWILPQSSYSDLDRLHWNSRSQIHFIQIVLLHIGNIRCSDNNQAIIAFSGPPQTALRQEEASHLITCMFFNSQPSLSRKLVILSKSFNW